MSNTVFGIDFGTTRSCVSYFNKELQDLVVISNKNGNYTPPTIIYFDPDSDDILYGDEIISNLKTTKIENLFTNIKRLIGKEIFNLDKNTRVFFNNNIIENDYFIYYKKGKKCKITLEEIIIHYLNYLKKYAMDSLNLNIQETVDVVITVPAYYNELQRSILKTCFLKCNMNVIRIVNEPTSAALYYNYLLSKKQVEQVEQVEKEHDILVFDCGGGTTDISIIHVDNEEKMYDVVEVVGDNYLGGLDVTNLLVEYFYKKIDGIVGKDKLYSECERLKCDLTFNDNSTIYIESCDFKYKVSRYLFNQICKPFFDKIQLLIKKLRIIEGTSISKVIFVGGCSNIPYLQEMFSSKFPNAKMCLDVDKDKIVSLGAVLQGVLLRDLFKKDCNFRESLLVDITHLTLGVETVGGIMCPIISKNTIIPTSRTMEFTNSSLTEDDVDINVYQGERRYVKDNFLICKCTLHNVPTVEKKLLIIKVTFSIDSDGILTIEAKLKNDENTFISITKNIKSDITLNKINENIQNAEEYKIIESEIK